MTLPLVSPLSTAIELLQEIKDQKVVIRDLQNMSPADSRNPPKEFPRIEITLFPGLKKEKDNGTGPETPTKIV